MQRTASDLKVGDWIHWEQETLEVVSISSLARLADIFGEDEIELRVKVECHSPSPFERLVDNVTLVLRSISTSTTFKESLRVDLVVELADVVFIVTTQKHEPFLVTRDRNRAENIVEDINGFLWVHEMDCFPQRGSEWESEER